MKEYIIHSFFGPQENPKKIYLWFETFANNRFQSIHSFSSLSDLNLFQKINLYCNKVSTIYLPLPYYNNTYISPFYSYFKQEDLSDKEIELKEISIKALSVPIEVFYNKLIDIIKEEEHNIFISPDTEYIITLFEYIDHLLFAEKYIPWFQFNDGAKAPIFKPYLDIKEEQDLKLLIDNIPQQLCFKGFNDTTLSFYNKRDWILFFIENALNIILFDIINNKLSRSKQKLIKKENIFFDTSLIEEEKFEKNYRLWFSEKQEEKGDFHLCLFVHPKSEDFTQWQIEYIMQSFSDPSIYIPAKDIWSDTKIESLPNNLNTIFLQELGKASEIIPEIEMSLNQRVPCGIDIKDVDAYKFLTETYFLLEEKGITVKLPPFWNNLLKPKIKLNPTIRKKVSDISHGILTANSLIDFKWKVAVGDEIISEREFWELVDMKKPIINMKGKWVEIKESDVEHIKNLINKFKQNNTYQFFDAIRIINQENEIEVLEDNEFYKCFNNLTNVKSFNILDAPNDFRGKLREYQKVGLSFLDYLTSLDFGSILADDMGLGKTIQIIALLLKNNTRNNLLICPASLIYNWQFELSRFSPNLKIHIHHGSKREKQELPDILAKHNLVITSYGMLRRDIKYFENITLNYVIIDEAQNIKNPLAKQTKAIKSLDSNIQIALTGTPVENRLMELWSIMDFCNRGLLGSYNDFKERYELPIMKHKDYEKLDRLKRITRPFILRRLKTDENIIKDLPEKQEIKVICSLSKEQLTLYSAQVKTIENVLTGMEDDTKGIKRKGLILSSILKLKQICNHPAQFLGDSELSNIKRAGKLERLIEMLEEIIQSNEKALIFSQYTDMLSKLKEILTDYFKIKILYLYGGTSIKSRKRMVDEFQKDERCKIFLLSLKAGGTGLNLTAANNVFHFDRWWNPAVENQATDRIFRIGQKKNVFIYKFISKGTIEEKIDKLIESKRELAEKVLSSGESFVTELSNKEFLDLIKLEEEK